VPANIAADILKKMHSTASVLLTLNLGKSSDLSGVIFQRLISDRRFLATFLPEVEEWLHYRSIDVSTVKELAKRWYPTAVADAPQKVGHHRALDQVGMRVNAGEIVALLGENGAGKSTLMKILAGADRKDEGRILLDGEEVRISGPSDALGWGIAIQA